VPWWYYSDAYRYTCCSNHLVIRYAGTPECQVPAAHGNSLSNQPYIRTKPSVLEKVKEVVTATGGHAGPAKVYKEAVSGNTSTDPRVCPRNIKQVSLCLEFGDYFFAVHEVASLLARTEFVFISCSWLVNDILLIHKNIKCFFLNYKTLYEIMLSR